MIFFYFKAIDKDDENTDNSKFNYTVTNSTDASLQNNITIDDSGNMGLTAAVDYEKLVSDGESQTIVNISVNATDWGTTPLTGATVVRLFIRVTSMF